MQFTVFRIPNREVLKVGEVEVKEPFDVFSDTSLESVIKSDLLTTNSNEDLALIESIKFHAESVDTNFGFKLPSLDFLSVELLGQLRNSLIHKSLSADVITLRSDSGWNTSRAAAVWYGVLVIFFDRKMSEVKRSNRVEDRFIASQYLKIRNAFISLLFKCLEKERRYFIGTVLVSLEDGSSSRYIYVDAELSSNDNDAKVNEKLQQRISEKG